MTGENTLLDKTSYPEFCKRASEFEAQGAKAVLRVYPGYPLVKLSKPRSRRLAALDSALSSRRSIRAFSDRLPTRNELGHLLFFAHAAATAEGKGPVPSAGELEGLQLYFAVLNDSWLAAGNYHYDRRHHHLALISPPVPREKWNDWVPSMAHFIGANLLWILISDQTLLTAKYGERARHFAALEAGHLMQNLCLLSESKGLATLPLGAFFEADIRRTLQLPGTDQVLYCGACGEPARS